MYILHVHIFLFLQGIQMYYIISYTSLKPAADFAELFRIAKLMLAICKIQATHTHTHTHAYWKKRLGKWPSDAQLRQAINQFELIENLNAITILLPLACLKCRNRLGENQLPIYFQTISASISIAMQATLGQLVDTISIDCNRRQRPTHRQLAEELVQFETVSCNTKYPDKELNIINKLLAVVKRIFTRLKYWNIVYTIPCYIYKVYTK